MIESITRKGRVGAIALLPLFLFVFPHFAAAQADGLAQDGSERELADLRAKWGDDLEASARSADFRERAVAYRARLKPVDAS